MLEDMFFTLDDENNIVPCDDFRSWGAWAYGPGGDSRRKVGYDVIGQWEISTVFLGISHGDIDGEPVLFETILFDRGKPHKMERYTNWNSAESGHAEMVEVARRHMEKAGLEQIKAGGYN